jgi:5-hydroxyisourate hydrolase
MAKLSTHVLDTAQGKPAKGLTLRLFRWQGSSCELIKTTLTNSDGRADAPLLEGASLVAGRYRLEFDVAPYFAQSGLELPSVPFLDMVPLEFGISDASQNYHVPLLLSPWSYSTYRGS